MTIPFVVHKKTAEEFKREVRNHLKNNCDFVGPLFFAPGVGEIAVMMAETGASFVEYDFAEGVTLEDFEKSLKMLARLGWEPTHQQTVAHRGGYIHLMQRGVEWEVAAVYQTEGVTLTQPMNLVENAQKLALPFPLAGVAYVRG